MARGRERLGKNQSIRDDHKLVGITIGVANCRLRTAHLPSIRMTRACPLLLPPPPLPPVPLPPELPLPLGSVHPFRFTTPCSNLLLCNLRPMRTYSAHITIMGPTKNTKLDTSNVWSISLFFICWGKGEVQWNRKEGSLFNSVRDAKGRFDRS